MRCKVTKNILYIKKLISKKQAYPPLLSNNYPFAKHAESLTCTNFHIQPTCKSHLYISIHESESQDAVRSCLTKIRGAERSYHKVFLCFRLPPAHKKRPPFCGLSLWSWRRKEPPVAVPPASEAKSRGAEHSLLLPSSHASDSLLPHKKDRSLAVIFLWSWRESNPRPNK